MVHRKQIGRDVGDRVRGTQYIRYLSGTNVPDGISLGKWYKRDIDVQIVNAGWNPRIVTWDVSAYVFDEIYPITTYEAVK
ncbi:hypothetical protein [Bacillus solimangrovi]|uniref:Uncharacterized protein n=1 Tax=Bacillus solimangrovi TaxID=1305675 RepID=A0A1E5LJ48_9BACI|nr:hypothetical protein [Bacillus solimangrovi]OEH94105.1 hypothetical protein BFG57_09670 [Bacillus solimangrovi]